MDIDEIYKQIGESGRQQIKYGIAMWIIKVLYNFFYIINFNLALYIAIEIFSSIHKIKPHIKKSQNLLFYIMYIYIYYL